MIKLQLHYEEKGGRHVDNLKLIQKTLDHIEDNLTAELTAKELAERAGFSLWHFYRLFHSAVGMPVMQYITRRKLLYAIYAIGCGEKGIDAALNYGFDTYAGFYRAFRREFTMTPSAYLKRYPVRKPYRIDLSKEEHIMISHKKIKELLRHWNMQQLPICDIYYEGSGEKNENACYIGDDHVLKLYVSPGRMKKQLELSQALRANGLLAPSVVRTTDGADYLQDGELYFVMTTRLAGCCLTAKGAYAGDHIAKGRFIGEAVGQLHLTLQQINVVVDENHLAEKIRDWALPTARKIIDIPDTIAAFYETTFETITRDLPTQIIHRDPNPGNIICTEDGQQWGFIDFDLSERNFRIYDPCYAATAILSETFDGENEELLRRWLEIYHSIIEGYDSVVGLTPAEKSAIPYMLLANQLVCVAWFSEQAKEQELFIANKEMTKWILSVFEELEIR